MATTLDIPIDLAGTNTVEIVNETGYTLRLVGGAAVTGGDLVVVEPAEYANAVFPLAASGACAPYDSVRIYNDDTGRTVAADALGSWSTTLPTV